MVNSHDPAYLQLYSHPEMVADLLLGYVREDWVAELKLDSLRVRADDIIWRVRWGERRLYLYLLIEFQSSVDRFMAVRLLTYVGLLYQDLKRTGRLETNEPLPPILPIVLYNGEQPWNAADSLADMLEQGLPGVALPLATATALPVAG